jgi:hypothetical protein
MDDNEDTDYDDDDDDYDENNANQLDMVQDVVDHRDNVGRIQEQLAAVDVPIAGVDGQIAGVANEIDDVENADDTLVQENHQEEVNVNNQDDIEANMNERYGPRNGQYNLRPRRERNYAHMFVNSGVPLSTPQMSMKQGIAMFGDDGIAAVTAELKQLHDRKVMVARHQNQLTSQEKKNALAYLMFLKQKQCGKVKARGCADGRKQRN